jgi:hypothetical protein
MSAAVLFCRQLGPRVMLERAPCSALEFLFHALVDP